jgi:hypothetical protein
VHYTMFILDGVCFSWCKNLNHFYAGKPYNFFMPLWKYVCVKVKIKFY